MTLSFRAASARASKWSPGRQRWLGVFAAFALLAGLAHVWSHYAGQVDADHFGQNAVEDCLLCESPAVAPAAPVSAPLLLLLFLLVAPALVLAGKRAQHRRLARGPPRS